ncbi:MAG: transposase [Candidatus Azotimanducaceae bacterium]|jgi:transposase
MVGKSLHQVPPKSAIGKVLVCLGNEWPRLIHYVGDGRLPIDNNPCENAIRPFVIGRKNWLLAQSQAGAEASANIYSIIETAKRSGHEPWHYLNFLLDKLPNTALAELHKLLPHKLPPITFEKE